MTKNILQTITLERTCGGYTSLNDVCPSWYFHKFETFYLVSSTTYKSREWFKVRKPYENKMFWILKCYFKEILEQPEEE